MCIWFFEKSKKFRFKNFFVLFLLLKISILIGTFSFLQPVFSVTIINNQNNNSFQLIQENTVLPINKPYQSLVKKIKVIVTGYSSTEDQTDSDPYITASGNFVRDGIIATNILPFGTKVQIPELYGNKIFTVEDRMHFSKKYSVDIWFSDTEQALKFGVTTTDLVILQINN